jgi:hypothetical protein
MLPTRGVLGQRGDRRWLAPPIEAEPLHRKLAQRFNADQVIEHGVAMHRHDARSFGDDDKLGRALHLGELHSIDSLGSAKRGDVFSDQPLRASGRRRAAVEATDVAADRRTIIG